MKSAHPKDPDEDLTVEENDTDQAEDKDSDKQDESSDEESEDEGEQEEDVKVQFERIIADFKDGTMDINAITRKPAEFNYLDQKTNDHNPRNLLHMIAEAGRNSTRALKPLVEHLIKHHSRLMKETDNSGTTPLQAAIMAGLAKLIDYMCDAYDAKNDIDDVLAVQDSKNNNCMHKAMLSKHKYARKIALRLIKRVRNVEMLCAQNNDLKTPLHIAVEWERCTESQKEVVEALVSACDAALDVNVGADVDTSSLSVYRYHEKTRQEAKRADDTAKDKKEERINHELGDASGVNSRNPKETPKSIPGKHQTPKVPDQPRLTPLDQPSRSKEQPHSKYKDVARDRQDLPMRGILRQPTRSDIGVGKGAHTGESKSATKEVVKKEVVTDATANKIKDFLKLHYMGTREDHESIVSFLYGPIQEKELYWSLADGPPVISLQRLQNMGYVQFEDTLKYVLLPNIRVTGSRALGKPASKDVGRGRDDYWYIFDWLKKRGVKRIFNLYIDDREEPSHSDEIIEKSLQGIEVRKVWDWQRLDLSSEVIVKAAPKVRQVNLYWGGNNAILRSWSEYEGLNQLNKLESVKLYTRKGLESRSREIGNLRAFSERLLNNRSMLIQSFENRKSKDADNSEKPPPQINIERDALPEKKVETGEMLVASQEQRKDHHKWLTCMDEFATFVQNIQLDTSRSSGLKPRPITVALIDDGFDMNEQSVVDKVIGGRSFCNQNNLNAPYWATSGFHGTVMASLICRVCPKVQLYILRLDEHKSKEQGQRQITAKSAEKAVRAAIDRGVDIISMSWTIEKTLDNEADIKRLEVALDEAAKKDILLFCSANDQAIEADKSHPATNPTRFRIGAATAQGTAWKWTRAEQVDFIFPGDNVIKERPGNVPVEKCSLVSGSSVATALAAGLAAMVLYCVQFSVFHRNAASQQSKGVITDEFDAMRTRERMAEAFHEISTTKSSDHKYIEVWNTFETAPREGEGKETGVKRDILATVADKLKSRKKLVFGPERLL